MKSKKMYAYLLTAAILAGISGQGDAAQAKAESDVTLAKSSISLTISTKDGKTTYGAAKIKVKAAKGVKVKKITYKSTDSKAAAVDKKGKVKAKSAGSARIRVAVKYTKKKKSLKKTLTCKVKVKKGADSTAPVTVPTAGAPVPAAPGQGAETKESPLPTAPGQTAPPVQTQAPGQIQTQPPHQTNDPDDDTDDPADETDAPYQTGEPDKPKVTFHPEDRKALEELIREQNAKGANMPTIEDDEHDANEYGGARSYTPEEGTGRLECLIIDNLDISGDVSLSSFKHLKYIECTRDFITSLDVSGCTELETLYCGGNQLSSLDVSNNKKLKNLLCSGNNMISLNLNGADALAWLECERNLLTKVDVSHNSMLEYICYDSGTQVSYGENMPSDISVWNTEE